MYTHRQVTAMLPVSKSYSHCKLFISHSTTTLLVL